MAKQQIQTLPYNLEAEQSLLGSMLIDQELQSEIRAQLSVEDFYVESHKLVFEGICSVIDDSKPLDVVTVADIMNKSVKPRKKVSVSSLANELENKTTLEKAGGIEYITKLAMSTPSASNYEYYLKIVKRDSTLRKLIRSAEQIINDSRYSNDEKKSLELAEKLIYAVSESQDMSSLRDIKKSLTEVIALFENIQKDANFMQGMHTGFIGYDKMTNGLHGGNLIILAARPSVGKSTFAMNIVENIAIKKEAVCAVFALEMGINELTERMISSVSGIPIGHSRSGKLTTDEWHKIWDAEKTLRRTKIFVDDTPMTTIPEILSKCRRLKSQQGKLDLIVVDHIQLMNATRSSENRLQEITEISRGLKMIAKELDVPVLALSQLSRSVEKDNRKPILSDLRESGSIEQDADVVMFIHRQDMVPTKSSNKMDKQAPQQIEQNENDSENIIKKDEAEIIVAKNRSGPRGSFKLLFKGEYSKFVNITYEDAPSYTPKNNQNSGLEKPEFKFTRSNEFENMPVDDFNNIPTKDSAEEFIPPVNGIDDVM